jgi:hypothetical protein
VKSIIEKLVNIEFGRFMIGWTLLAVIVWAVILYFYFYTPPEVEGAESVALAYEAAASNARWEDAVTYLGDDYIERFVADLHADPKDLLSSMKDSAFRTSDSGGSRASTKYFETFYTEEYFVDFQKRQRLALLERISNELGRHLSLEDIARMPQRELYVLMRQVDNERGYGRGVDLEVGDPEIWESVLDKDKVHVFMRVKTGMDGRDWESSTAVLLKRDGEAWKIDHESYSNFVQSPRGRNVRDHKGKDFQDAVWKKISEQNKLRCEDKFKQDPFKTYLNLNNKFPKNYTGKAKAWFGLVCYIGDFEKERPGGAGWYLASDGSEYEGAVKNILPHGIGRFVHPSGWAYEGSWKDGMPEEGKCFDKGNVTDCKVIEKYGVLYAWEPYQRIAPWKIARKFAPFARNYDALFK